MESSPVVTGKFDKGKAYDSFMLFAGIALVIVGFLTLYETDMWQARDDLWKPVSGTGVLLVLFNIILRLFRKKLIVDLLVDNGKALIITPVRNLQFSGWVKSTPVTVKKSDIAMVKVNDFYNAATGAGLIWVAFELNSKMVVELKIIDDDVKNQVIEFVKHHIPDVELKIDGKD